MGYKTVTLTIPKKSDPHFMCENEHIHYSKYMLWYSNLAGARQGRGGGETVRKPEGLGKDPREGCLYLRKKGTR